MGGGAETGGAARRRTRHGGGAGAGAVAGGGDLVDGRGGGGNGRGEFCTRWRVSSVKRRGWEGGEGGGGPVMGTGQSREDVCANEKERRESERERRTSSSTRRVGTRASCLSSASPEVPALAAILCGRCGRTTTTTRARKKKRRRGEGEVGKEREQARKRGSRSEEKRWRTGRSRRAQVCERWDGVELRKGSKGTRRCREKRREAVSRCRRAESKSRKLAGALTLLVVCCVRFPSTTVSCRCRERVEPKSEKKEGERRASKVDRTTKERS